MGKSKGWVRLWREQFTHWISERKPWCDGYAWAYLYSQANHKPGIVNFRNQYIRVERGEMVTSKLKLRQLFGWSRKRMEGFIFALKREGMCTYRSTNRFLVISICNYDKYQSKEELEEQTEGHTKEQTESKQSATNKNDKNVKNKDLSNGTFDLFYIPYPKHEGKAKALKAWKKLNPDNELIDTILAAITRQKKYKECLQAKGQFCPEWPMPATWLNGRRWEDEIPEAKDSW